MRALYHHSGDMCFQQVPQPRQEIQLQNLFANFFYRQAASEFNFYMFCILHDLIANNFWFYTFFLVFLHLVNTAGVAGEGEKFYLYGFLYHRIGEQVYHFPLI